MVVSIIYINTTKSLRITSKEFKNDLFVISDPRGNWQLLASQQGCLDLTLPQTKKNKKRFPLNRTVSKRVLSAKNN
jgi:hypothetical protein